MLFVICFHCVYLNGDVVKQDVTHISHLLRLTNGKFIKRTVLRFQRTDVRLYINTERKLLF